MSNCSSITTGRALEFLVSVFIFIGLIVCIALSNLIYHSFSQGSFCVVLQWESCCPPVSTYLHIKHRHSIPSMTKTKHQWLPSLHHGYQTDGGLGKLNTKYPGGDEGKIGGDVSFFFFQYEHLHTRFTSVQTKHPPNCQKRGQRFPSTSPGGRRALSRRCSTGMHVEEEMDQPIGGDLIYSSGSLLWPSRV